MKRNISFERIVKTAAHGTEKEAGRLTYDILCENVADICRFVRHLGITYDELQELKKKLYEQR